MTQNIQDSRAVLQRKLAEARQQVAALEESLRVHREDAQPVSTLDASNASDSSLTTVAPLETVGPVFEAEDFSRESISSSQSALLDIVEVGILEWSIPEASVKSSRMWNHWFGSVDANTENPLKSLYAHVDPRDLHFVTSQLNTFFNGAERNERITLRVPNQGKIQWIEVTFIVQRALNNSVIKLSCFAMDVTYYKEKELFFKKELDILNDARVGFPSVSLHVNSQFTMTKISPGAYHYTDVNPENLTNIPLGVFFDPPSYAFIQQEIEHVLHTQKPSKCKAPLTFYNNTTISAIIQFWPEKPAAGEEHASVNILIWDTESTNYLVENFYRLFSNLMDGFILVQSLSPRHNTMSEDTSAVFAIIVMNQSLATMYGTNFRQYVGQELKSLVGSDFEQWEICLQQVAMRKKPVVYCMKSKEKPILLEISAFPSGLDNIGCIVKDVTAMHAAEQAVLLNEARSSALYRLSYMYSLPINSVLTYALTQMIQLTESETGMLAFFDMDSGKYELWSQTLDGVVVRKNILLEDLERIEGFHQVRLSGTVVEPFIVDKVEEPFVCSNGKQAVRYMIAPVVDEGKLVCLARVSNKGSSYAEGDLL